MKNKDDLIDKYKLKSFDEIISVICNIEIDLEKKKELFSIIPIEKMENSIEKSNISDLQKESLILLTNNQAIIAKIISNISDKEIRFRNIYYLSNSYEEFFLSQYTKRMRTILLNKLDDKYKIKMIQNLNDSDFRNEIIEKLVDDDSKIKALMYKINDEKLRTKIIKNISKDESKVNGAVLFALKGELDLENEILENISSVKRLKICSELNDDKKLVLIKTSNVESFKNNLLKTIKDNSIKEEAKRVFQDEVAFDKIKKLVRPNRAKFLNDIYEIDLRKKAITIISKDDLISYFLGLNLQEKEDFLDCINVKPEIAKLLVNSITDINEKMEIIKNTKSADIQNSYLKCVKNDEIESYVISISREKALDYFKKIKSEKYQEMFIERMTAEDRLLNIGLSDSEEVENKIVKSVSEKGRKKFISVIPEEKILKILEKVRDEEFKKELVNGISSVKGKDINEILKMNFSSTVKMAILTNWPYDNISIGNQKYDNLKFNKDNIFEIEIELKNKNSDVLIGCKKLLGDWNIECCDDKIKIISDKMNDSNDNIIKIYKIFELLRKLGQTVDKNYEIRFYFEDLCIKNIESIYNLIEIYGNCKKIFYIILNKPGEVPNNKIINYEKSFVMPFIEKNINNNVLLEKISNSKKHEILSEIGKYKINIEDMKKTDKKIFCKNKIECLSMNGIDPQEENSANYCIENLIFYNRYFEICDKLSDIENKDKPTTEEIDYYFIKENLKNDISDNEKLENLLNLLFSKDEENFKQLFKVRYNETIEKIKSLKTEQNQFSRIKNCNINFERETITKILERKEKFNNVSIRKLCKKTIELNRGFNIVKFLEMKEIISKEKLINKEE